jgi:DNA repair protein RadC
LSLSHAVRMRALSDHADVVSTLVAAHPDDDEGSLRIAFLDRRGQLLATTRITEGTGCVDELFLRHLVDEVVRMAAPGALVVVRRALGRPTRVDRLIWRELSRRVTGPAAVIDLLVVGHDRRWSVGTGARA